MQLYYQNVFEKGFCNEHVDSGNSPWNSALTLQPREQSQGGISAWDPDPWHNPGAGPQPPVGWCPAVCTLASGTSKSQIYISVQGKAPQILRIFLPVPPKDPTSTGKNSKLIMGCKELGQDLGFPTAPHAEGTGVLDLPSLCASVP